MIRSGISRSDFVIATRKMHAFMQVHLTVANQSEIGKAYLVSVIITTSLPQVSHLLQARRKLQAMHQSVCTSSL